MYMKNTAAVCFLLDFMDAYIQGCFQTIGHVNKKGTRLKYLMIPFKFTPETRENAPLFCRFTYIALFFFLL